MAPVTAVSTETPRELAGSVSDWLSERGLFCSAWEDLEGGPSRIEIFVPESPEDPDWAPYTGMLCETPEEAATHLREACAAFGLKPDISVATVAAEDWANSWKRFFKTMRVSPRLVVRPPWEEYAAAPGERVIVMDPGMSFGTGRHATTQACLQLIDGLAAENRGRRFLDVGCGSGILSIAASLLGFGEVRGIDNDPDAVRIAAENAAANGAAATFAVCDLAQCDEKAPVVVANVLAVVLTQYAREVAGCVERVPGCALVLSGILDTQYDGVKAAYEALGAHEEKTILVGEWRTGLFRFQ